MPTISPSSTAKSMALSACTPPKRMPTSRTSRTGTDRPSRDAGDGVVAVGRLPRSERQPPQQLGLLLGDAARIEDQRDDEQQRADGRFEAGVDPDERHDVEVLVGPLEQRREHGEQ